MKDITVVSASKSDVEDIFGAEQRYIDCPWTKRQIEEAISAENTVFLVARIDGEFAGYCSGTVAADECEVSNIAVEIAYRRKGIGRALLSSLIDGATKRGACKTFLLVRDGNVPAESLYASLGFKAVGMRRAYYDGGDALIMRLDMQQ